MGVHNKQGIKRKQRERGRERKEERRKKKEMKEKERGAGGPEKLLTRNFIFNEKETRRKHIGTNTK